MKDKYTIIIDVKSIREFAIDKINDLIDLIGKKFGKKIEKLEKKVTPKIYDSLHEAIIASFDHRVRQQYELNHGHKLDGDPQNHSLYVGDIPYNWEERIDEKINEKYVNELVADQKLTEKIKGLKEE